MKPIFKDHMDHLPAFTSSNQQQSATVSIHFREMLLNSYTNNSRQHQIQQDQGRQDPRWQVGCPARQEAGLQGQVWWLWHCFARCRLFETKTVRFYLQDPQDRPESLRWFQMCQLCQGENRQSLLDRGAEDRQESVEGAAGQGEEGRQLNFSPNPTCNSHNAHLIKLEIDL